MKRLAFAVFAAAVVLGSGAALGEAQTAQDLHLLPRPSIVQVTAGCSLDAGRVLASLRETFPGELAGARDLIDERWRALGVVARGAALPITIAMQTKPPSENVSLDPNTFVLGQGYTLDVTAAGIHVTSADSDGAFYAFVTLAQLVGSAGGARASVPCVRIEDAPALRWRVLSDDVSRGPLPNMRYFEERIRTIAAFKMNGYSPYMEHVFADPKHPLPAPPDGITPAQLHELATYARRFHVALIPEQQTFAHMHETLKLEQYAPLAELPHGWLLTPANPAAETYAQDLIADELTAVPHPPFFHIGSDEPSDLGRGAAQALVAADGDGPLYARHVVDTANFVIAHDGGRPMIWDDALARHPELFATLPKSLVFVNWHYGSDATYVPYIQRIARGGFEQMVAPGALNWNEIYPDLDAALGNIDRFVSEGKAAKVLGLFQTVWHDDGETLFEATWYPVVYAAASAWERSPVDRLRYAADFPVAFFGSSDSAYARDFGSLADCRSLLAENPREYGDYLFWSDPFDSDLASLPDAKISALRLAAERVMTHLRTASPPPLHPQAAAVMAFAAQRYDALGRQLQIGREAPAYYAEAQRLVTLHDSYAYRNLLVTKYLFWELRDATLALETLHRTAWEYENRSSHESSVLERYRIAADRAIERADRISDATIDFEKKHTPLPPFSTFLHAQ